MHAFVTKHYFESPWCLAELRLWRILGALQSWRTTSYTLIHGELTNMPAGLLIGPVVDSNNIFRRDDLRDLLRAQRGRQGLSRF